MKLKATNRSDENIKQAKTNTKLLGILRQGVKVWNKWREENPLEILALSHADLRGRNLRGANFQHMKFSEVNFEHAKLDSAYFAFAFLFSTKLNHANAPKSNFREARIFITEFQNANLKHSSFHGAKMLRVRFAKSDLSASSLYDVLFENCDFDRAKLSHANLQRAKFIGSSLPDTIFNHSKMGDTIMARTDLGRAKGLASVVHNGSSSISSNTLCFSSAAISDKFLRETGVPEPLITSLPSLREAIGPSQRHSCFISYSTRDEKFAKRLHARMRQAGLRVWLALEDLKGGDYFFDQIERAIQLHDRLLLVLSEDSIRSKWVEREIRKARKVERVEMRRKLFPIRLAGMKTLKEWECIDSDTGEDLAEEVRKYHIPDFSNWKKHDDFEKAFTRLEQNLQKSIKSK